MIWFADTFYFLALLNAKDAAHAAAVSHSTGPGRILTTEWVLAEVGGAMAGRAKRQAFIKLYRILRSDAGVEIVEASAEHFARGMDLFERRADKEWSLTDCISFVVMQERGVTEALTGDRHFEQAGFRALLA